MGGDMCPVSRRACEGCALVAFDGRELKEGRHRIYSTCEVANGSLYSPTSGFKYWLEYFFAELEKLEVFVSPKGPICNRNQWRKDTLPNTEEALILTKWSKLKSYLGEALPVCGFPSETDLSEHCRAISAQIQTKILKQETEVKNRQFSECAGIGIRAFFKPPCKSGYSPFFWSSFSCGQNWGGRSIEFITPN